MLRFPYIEESEVLKSIWVVCIVTVGRGWEEVVSHTGRPDIIGVLNTTGRYWRPSIEIITFFSPNHNSVILNIHPLSFRWVSINIYSKTVLTL